MQITRRIGVVLLTLLGASFSSVVSGQAFTEFPIPGTLCREPRNAAPSDRLKCNDYRARRIRNTAQAASARTSRSIIGKDSVGTGAEVGVTVGVGEGVGPVIAVRTT